MNARPNARLDAALRRAAAALLRDRLNLDPDRAPGFASAFERAVGLQARVEGRGLDPEAARLLAPWTRAPKAPSRA